MAAEVINFGSSVPGNTTGSLNRPIPAAPGGIILAEFGFALDVSQTANRIELIGTVGFTSTAGLPEVLFQITRGTQIIFAAQSSTVAVNENRIATFQMVENNVPVGVVLPYRILARVVNNPALNNASVLGPVTFSGTAYRIF
ncbi:MULTISPECIES: hypothetical protein [unclassified Paenibacillus]|uniref:hypothetical protein n=1 Tax=unclassified Paenibacillus TaxID=185978 RepID=UPI0027887AB7|nr:MULTISPECIES: hypothetical protein [unclassified Paenibacillus]MDQ0901549.1 hypothetical protein [Paenibacillus sp. V4I7]MDQ0919948.1 hypothetical protein [Paenibacillus sp. V4I5]